jgi:flagellar biosynthesis/type III secretory pathway ATPase
MAMWCSRGPSLRRAISPPWTPWPAFADKRDLVALGAYRRGGDPLLDEYLDRREAIEAFLRQGPGEQTPLSDTVAWLGRLAAGL